MGDAHEPDPFDLQRFVQAQARHYAGALAEIRGGEKQSHWMWFIFPQFNGLGFSPTSQFYSIKSLQEASAYLAHPILGPRLLECADATLQLRGLSAHEIFGSPDDLKLHSSATLFSLVSPEGSVFHRLIEKYFDGKPDAKTLTLVASTGRPKGRPLRDR